MLSWWRPLFSFYNSKNRATNCAEEKRRAGQRQQSFPRGAAVGSARTHYPIFASPASLPTLRYPTPTYTYLSSCTLPLAFPPLMYVTLPYLPPLPFPLPRRLLSLPEDGRFPYFVNQQINRRGVVVVRGVVPPDTALRWRDSLMVSSGTVSWLVGTIFLWGP